MTGYQNAAAIFICIALASIALVAFRKFFGAMSQRTDPEEHEHTIRRRTFTDAELDMDRKWARNQIAQGALNGLLACPPGPNDQAKDRAPEALAELAILYANELVSLEDTPVRSSAEVRSAAWAFRNAMMKACGGQVLTQSQLEWLEGLDETQRSFECKKLAEQWEIDRVKLREEIDREHRETQARVERNAETLKRAKSIREKMGSEIVKEARPG